MRRRKILAMVAAAVLGVSAISAPAHAAPAAPVIDVQADDDGFTAPASFTSGTTSFRVTTTAAGDLGSIIGLVRLRPGTAPASFAGHLGKVFSDDPRVAVPAGRALMAEAELLGGAESRTADDVHHHAAPRHLLPSRLPRLRDPDPGGPGGAAQADRHARTAPRAGPGTRRGRGDVPGCWDYPAEIVSTAAES